ncbi:MAG: hypothetical protein ACLS3C_10765 [Oscillospiraceae bacterium]
MLTVALARLDVSAPAGCAKKFTDLGAKVALPDITVDRVQALADKLGLGSDRAFCAAVDVSNEESVIGDGRRDRKALRPDRRSRFKCRRIPGLSARVE